MENGLRPPIQMAAEAMRTMQIGFQGEQNAQQIRINVQKWLEKWPDASIHLMLTLPGEKTSYPANTRIENGELIFLPGYGDTQKAGHGAAYVAATRDGTHLAVSETVLTEILLRGRGGETIPEAPEAQAGWVANVLDAAHRAEEAAKRAENAQVTDEQVGKAVEDFLRENPVEFEEKDPTVPEWAKAKEKPTYTAEEVGAQPKGDYALVSEIPAPYTLPVASADTLGGVKVGDGLQMDGEKLAIADGLRLHDSVEVKEGEEVKSFSWRKSDEKYKEYQIFCYFPVITGSEAVRVTGNMGSVLYYLQQGLMTDAPRYAWLKHENRKNAFPFEGYCGPKDGYASIAGILGSRLSPCNRDDLSISVEAKINFPVGTTIKVYVR